ncbi:MAG: ROK family protein [Fusobacterium mortiferum]|uniref:ROK family protein n=1 Tax=Fusobacterium mortiferum TaxID=850 RepID=UPI002A7DCE2E|nr:ROK family protein [Fusobacterium mortiferum]MCI7666466.1 ROK family protein [Fusobacterium mortiferum]MDY2801094.1 ROK family protein [Fusobacterium mortiferum]MDY4801653.1 ROK family protein [Fusobacterium mortiferum]
MYQIEQKKKNDSDFLNFIYKNKNFTISQVSKALKLTYPTSKRLVDDFLKKKIILQSDEITHTSGRSSVSFFLNTESLYSIGIQIELKKISFILIDLLGKIKKEKTILNLEFNNKSFTEILNSLFNEFYLEIEEEISQKILGIGISFPGIVDNKELKILDGINLNLNDIILNDIFRKYNKEIYLENDANACVYSEKILGKAQEYKNFVVISIGSGIGAGVYINSNLHHGNNNICGEFGHISIDFSGKKCNCGNKGCWELYVSETAIEEEFKNSNVKELDSIFDKNINKDFIERYTNFFSLGLSNILLTFDINNIIISGNLAKYIERYQQDILKNIQKNIFFKNYPLNILCSNLNERSSILGAALIPISNYFNLVNLD